MPATPPDTDDTGAPTNDGRLLHGRYRLTARLGSGGMADVYLAEDVRLGRQVAVKVLRTPFADDDEFVERFRIEAQAAALLNHPNIVTVHDRGHDDGQLVPRHGVRPRRDAQGSACSARGVWRRRRRRASPATSSPPCRRRTSATSSIAT